jgi:hypothetical protein
MEVQFQGFPMLLELGAEEVGSVSGNVVAGRPPPPGLGEIEFDQISYIWGQMS